MKINIPGIGDCLYHEVRAYPTDDPQLPVELIKNDRSVGLRIPVDECQRIATLTWKFHTTTLGKYEPKNYWFRKSDEPNEDILADQIAYACYQTSGVDIRPGAKGNAAEEEIQEEGNPNGCCILKVWIWGVSLYLLSCNPIVARIVGIALLLLLLIALIKKAFSVFSPTT